jgi:hypothetical protein
VPILGYAAVVVPPRTLRWYGPVIAEVPRSPSGPLGRWYGPTLAEQPSSIATVPPTAAMGAGPAPTITPYPPAFSQSYPVRAPVLVPRPLQPADANR